MGYCSGIENYSRHLTRRKAGEPPPTLMEYFPGDASSSSTRAIRQSRRFGNVKGDHSRKETLVDFGFRLPSALDNRPLRFEEFEAFGNQRVYVTATPAVFEMSRAEGGSSSSSSARRG